VTKGNEPHHAVMFPILPGKTLADVKQAFGSQSSSGPLPVDFESGANTAVLDGDSDVVLRKPGKYAVVCFLTDRDGKGKPHLAEGMLKEVEVGDRACQPGAHADAHEPAAGAGGSRNANRTAGGEPRAHSFAGACAAALRTAVEDGDARFIVIDLSGLTFVDCSAIRMLCAASERARAHGDPDRLWWLRPPEHVHRVSQLAGVGERLQFAD
jgi:ABC-type transporter Mla MlaB component